jgi:hypothetical protein
LPAIADSNDIATTSVVRKKTLINYSQVRCNLFSLYPDYTVGPGIKPGLLTLLLQ